MNQTTSRRQSQKNQPKLKIPLLSLLHNSSTNNSLPKYFLFTYFFIEFTCVGFRTGFPKVGQVVPLGAITDTQGATSSKGVRGGLLGHNFNLTLDILELQMKSKKKVLGIFNGIFFCNLVEFGHIF